jgi:hypothetical protein
MLESAAMADALRAGTRLRDKVIVVSVDAAYDAERIDALASDLALARALGTHVLAVAGAGVGPLPLDGQGPALRLRAGLERHRERPVLLPATGLLTIHRIPLAAASPGVPSMIPVLNPAIFLQLLALGYVPVVFAPAVDAAGGVVEFSADSLAALVAQFMGAALLALSPASAAEPPVAAPSLPPMPPIVVTDPVSPGRLIADLLHHAPSLPVTPTVVTGSGAALLSNPAPR